MAAEQEAVSPNNYPSPESVREEPIAILPLREGEKEGERKVLFRNQALIVQAILKTLKKSPDKTTFSSMDLHNAIWPGQPYRLGSITSSVPRLIPLFEDLKGKIAPHPLKSSVSTKYDICLPADVQAAIEIKNRKVPVGTTFHLPNGKVATKERAVVLHELVRRAHLTAESTIPTNSLWTLVYGDMPYDETSMSGLLREAQQDLEGTGMVVEKRINMKTIKNRWNKEQNVRTFSSVFLNLSGYIEKLRVETAEIEKSKIPTFTDEDILAFCALYGIFGSESILKKHGVKIDLILPSVIYVSRSEITGRFEGGKKKPRDPGKVIPELKQKLIQYASARVEGKEIQGSPHAKRVLSIFKDLDEEIIRECLEELIAVYHTYHPRTPFP